MENKEKTKKCSECLDDIPKKAKKCSHCGSSQKGEYGWGHAIIIIIAIFVFITIFSGDSTPTQQTQQVNTTKKQQVVNTSVYTTDLGRLEEIIIDKDRDVDMVSVQYALARLIDDDPRIFEYPFYAMKNQKGEGYIGIIVTNVGKALFLVPYKALNQTRKSDLEQSIKAINGTAKNLNYNLDFATGYDYLEVMDWVK